MICCLFIDLVFFVQAGKQSSTLKPVILQELMESHRRQICDLVSHEKQHPQTHAKFFDKYADLISRQVRRLDIFSAAFILLSLYICCEPSPPSPPVDII